MSLPTPSTDRISPQPWTRPSLVVLAVLVVVGISLGWGGRLSSLTIYGDDAIYQSLSHSLAAGRYRDEFLAGAPPHAQYPPGMAAYLLVIRTLAGPALDAALAANLLVLALIALLVADSLRRLATPWLGVAAAAMVLLNREIFTLMSELRSEVPFMLFTAAALWLSLLDGERARKWFPALALGAALAAFLTRSAGIALVPAIGWAMLLRKQWRPAIIGGAVSAAVVGGWFYYTRWATARTVGHSYAIDFLASPDASAGGILAHFLRNATTYFSRFSAVQFGIPDIHDQPLDNAVMGLFFLIAIVAGSWLLRRSWAAMVMYLLLSGAILLVFPWPVTRLLSGLLPWMIIAFLFGLFRLCARAGMRHAHAITLGVAAVVALLGFRSQYLAAQMQNSCRDSAPFTEARCATVEDRGYAAAARFIRDSLPAGAVVAASKPAILYLLSGHQTFPLELFARSSASRLMVPNGPATAVLLSLQFPYEHEVVATHLREQCAAMTLLFSDPSSTLLVSAGRAPGETRPDACAGIDRFLKEAPPAIHEDSE